MDFEFHFTKEDEEFRKEVRAFIEESALKEPVVPFRRWNISPELFRQGRELERKLGAKGWFAPNYPKEYGGGGLDLGHCLVLADEVDRITSEHRWPAGNVSGFEAPAIIVYGTEEQKRRWLPPFLQGEWEPWHCYTEPEAGTDEPNMQSTAVRDGDEWVINGTKIFVGSGPIHPDVLWWAAVTDRRAPRHRNLSCFIIPANLPGIVYLPLDFYINQVGQKWQVICEDVRIPVDHIVGEENNGWQLVRGVGGYGGLPRGGFSFSLVLKLIDYCKKTMRNGQPISKEPHIQDILVQLYTEYQVERLWGLRNFAMGHRQIPSSGYTTPQSSLHQKRFLPALGWALLDLLGPYALVEDPEFHELVKEVEYYIRESGCTHPGGTPEAQQINMSRGLGLGRGITKAAVAAS